MPYLWLKRFNIINISASQVLYGFDVISIKIPIIFHENFVTNFILMKYEQYDLNHFLD